MREDLIGPLDATIDRLQNQLEEMHPMDIVFHLGQSTQSSIHGGLGQTIFTAPEKQIMYLAGLLLATKNSGRRPLSTKIWDDVVGQVLQAFWLYMLQQFPPADSTIPVDDDFREHTEVTLVAFTDFLETGTLATIDQRVSRLRRRFDKLSDELRETIGCDVEDLLEAIDCITDAFATMTSGQIGEIRRLDYEMNLLSWNMTRSFSDYDSPSDMTNRNPAPNVITYVRLLNELSEKKYEARRKTFEIPWERLHRDDAQPALDWLLDKLIAEPLPETRRLYPSDISPAVTHPLLHLTSRGASLIHPGHLYPAAEHHLESVLKDAGYADRLRKIRDDALEAAAIMSLSSFVDQTQNCGDVEVFRNVCETSDGQREHDGLLRVDSTFIVVEAKASPLREPFRDPARAYERIRDDFRSDSGPQKAYDQGLRLRTRLLNEAGTKLYAEDGNVILETDEAAEDVLVVCIVDETYRGLGANPNLLLEKGVEDPTPLMVPLSDLENLLQGFRSLGKGISDLIGFLQARRDVSELIFTSDELDVATLYLAKGELDFIARQCEEDGAYRMVMSPTLSRVFDLLEMDREDEARAILSDLASSPDYQDATVLAARHFVDGLVVPPGSANPWVDSSPRDPCPCRSGQTYGECHGPRFEKILGTH